MSLTTRKPLRFLGGNQSSGHPYTGELPTTRGGMYNGTVWSGGVAPATRGLSHALGASGNQIDLTSGGGRGRLHTIMPHLQMVSGTRVFFYDAATIARSGAGPVADLLAESGARVIGIIPTTHLGGDVAGSQSGYPTQPWQHQIQVDAPFLSGLFVSAASGAPGFSFTYTLEVNPVDRETA